jgi:exopolysaccharide biosynthesis operon protein EpsL
MDLNRGMFKHFRTVDYEIAGYNPAKTVIQSISRAMSYSAIMGGVCLSMNHNAFATSTTDDTFRPYIGTTLTYDSNLLRLADSITPEQVAGKDTKSDFIKQIRGGVNIDWKISRQQVLAKLEVNQNWFQTFTELDYLGHNVLGQWNWQIGSKFNGEIGYSHKLTLGSFGQLNQLLNNLQTEEKYFANGAYQIFPSWFLRGGFIRNNVFYSEELQKISNRNENTGDFGLRYISPGKNMLGLQMAITDGNFPNRQNLATLDDAYMRNSYNLEWNWNYSIKTHIDGQLGYTQQEFERLSSRDFADITTRANIYWEITGKSMLFLSGWREIGQADNLNATFVLSQGARLIPIWLASPKIKLDMPISYEQQEFLGDPGFSQNNSAQARLDKLSKIGMNLSYKPLENTEMSLFIQYEERKSNNLQSNYKSHSAGIKAQVLF